jgi:hypothetical protein
MIRAWDSRSDIECMLILAIMGLCGRNVFVRNEQYVPKRLDFANAFIGDSFHHFRVCFWQASSSQELDAVLRETSNAWTNTEKVESFLEALFTINTEAGKIVQHVCGGRVQRRTPLGKMYSAMLRYVDFSLEKTAIVAHIVVDEETYSTPVRMKKDGCREKNEKKNEQKHDGDCENVLLIRDVTALGRKFKIEVEYIILFLENEKKEKSTQVL